MPPTAPPPYVSASYSPPQYLLLHWTAAELALQFQAFSDSLRYVENSPELVFERLVAGLNDGFSNTARRESAASDGWCGEMDALRGSIDELRAELAEVKSKGLSDCTPSITKDEKIRDLILHSKDTVENEWTRLVFKFTASACEVNVEGTTSASEPTGGCTWADIEPEDPFEHGHERFQDNLTTTITFTRPQPHAPRVTAWLTDVHFKLPLRVKVSAVDVTTNGFTLRVDAAEKTLLRSVGVAWVAIPIADDRVAIGSLTTRDDKTWKSPVFLKSGSFYINYLFSHSRRLVAISALDLEVGKQFSIRANTSYAATSIIGWTVDAGPEDLRLYSVGIVYVVIA